MDSSCISNHEVKFYMDKILKKISGFLKGRIEGKEYGVLDYESMYICILFFERFKIQFYTSHKLSIEFTNDLEKKYEYLDIVSIQTIQRSCYESYLLFNYLFLQMSKYIEVGSPEEYLEELNFKLLLYKQDGYFQAVNSSETEKEKEEAQKCKKTIEKKIRESSIYKSLDMQKQKELFKTWKPSWNDIAKNTIFSTWSSKKMYNIQSQTAHSSYISLIKMNYHYTNLEKYDIDSINLPLYSLVVLYVEDLNKLLTFPEEFFTFKELSLLGEFKYILSEEPSNILRK